MWGVIPKSYENTFEVPIRKINEIKKDHLLYGMVTCHSLTIMDGCLKGDPLDLKIFESTKWILEEANISDHSKYDILFPTYVKPNEEFYTQNHEKNFEIGIVREFSFTSALQRMSVVTRVVSDDHFNVYCKGSPEMIVALCKSVRIFLYFCH